MAGAIRLPSDRSEPAIGEISAPRIAQRPPAGGFTNVLEPQPSHLSDLDYAKASPCRPAVHRRDLGIASGGNAAALRVGVGPSGIGGGPLERAPGGGALP